MQKERLRVIYPFTPKSTAHLVRGQFWPIPLSNGQYGAGCVIGEMLNNGVKNARVFMGGVLHWICDTPPTPENLSRAKLYEYGFLHIKSIKEVGLPIVGEAQIEFDSAPAIAESLELPTWGYGFPRMLCETILLSGNSKTIGFQILLYRDFCAIESLC
ncbi:MAG: hypothetical protein J0653_02145 [Deltaproteobacteria bacterium]|nr:hypothetical protein [Deltaproteobacteria bacterium]